MRACERFKMPAARRPPKRRLFALKRRGGKVPQMTKAPKPSKDIPVDVKNPRYEGATIEMVAGTLLQRPREAEKAEDEEQSDG